MDISSSTINYAQQELQRLLSTMRSLQTQQAQSAGQDLPSTTSTDPASQGATPPLPPPPPPSNAASQFATDTLKSLLDAQTSAPSGSDLASQIISSLDQNGDGSLSLDEISKGLSSASSNGTSTDYANAFAKLDTNGDGSLSADELTSALKAYGGGHHHHHHRANADASATASAGATATTGVASGTDSTSTTVAAAA